jgi:integrase
MLAAFAGLRVGEIAKLRFADITATHLIVRGKGDKSRIVPLHPDLAADLAGELERRQAGRSGSGFRYDGNAEWVFPGRAGGPMHHGWASTVLSDVLGDGTTGHQLRHRFATRAYSVDRDLLAVSQLLGHSKPETTARYAAVPDGAALRAVLGAS